MQFPVAGRSVEFILLFFHFLPKSSSSSSLLHATGGGYLALSFISFVVHYWRHLSFFACPFVSEDGTCLVSSCEWGGDGLGKWVGWILSWVASHLVPFFSTSSLFFISLQRNSCLIWAGWCMILLDERRTTDQRRTTNDGRHKKNTRCQDRANTTIIDLRGHSVCVLMS